jgi:Tol biopolymer transport system component
MIALLAFAAWSADAREVASRDGANLQRPVWSPDAAKLAYEANYHEKKTIELYSGDPKLSAFVRVVPTVRSASAMTAGFQTAGAKGGMVAQDLDWSPLAYGKYVYSASNDTLDYDLYIGGGGALAASPGADGGAAWSPDGRWIAFTSSRTGQGDLYLLDVDAIDAPPRRLTTDPDATELFAAWSPDSAKLAFVGHSDRGDNLWWFPALDQPAVRVTDWDRSQLRPSFSPDGAHLAFYANHEDETRFDLYVVDAKTGGSPVAVAQDVVLNATGPTWTPDGKALIAVLDDDARYDPIAKIPVGGGAATILDFGTVGHGDLDVAKAADGKVWIAYVAQGKKTDSERTFDRLYVVEMPQ